MKNVSRPSGHKKRKASDGLTKQVGRHGELTFWIGTTPLILHGEINQVDRRWVSFSTTFSIRRDTIAGWKPLEKQGKL